MGVVIRGGGVTLPSPTEIKTSEEIIWSANTGRSATGLMLGDVVADKRTFTIAWGILTLAEYEKIRAALTSGFIPVVIQMDGTAWRITAYRGALSGEMLGVFGGTVYYKNTAVTLIQQ